MNQDEALTAEEVAKLLKVSRGTVYSLKDKGELPSFLVGRKQIGHGEAVVNRIKVDGASHLQGVVDVVNGRPASREGEYDEGGEF